MHALRLITGTVLVLAFVGAGNLSAQRRTTGGGGSAGRGSPSGSSGASSERGRGGGSTSRPSSGTRSGSASQARGSGQSSRPASGKIGAIREQARAAGARAAHGVIVAPVYVGACWGCNYWGWYGGYWGWYHGGWWYPAAYPYPREEGEEGGEALPGQGYLPYPYAGTDYAGDAFVISHARQRSAFGALSAQYFSDQGSTTRAGRFQFEGAIRLFRGELEYSQYAEPVQGGTDHLHTWRVSVGIQPRLGARAYLVGGVGLRGVVLDRGGKATGPEGELGVQVLPLRPFGINVTGRLAGLTWNGYDYFTLRELNTTGSVFLGRFELQAGWHWLKVGPSPAFGGPMVGTRLWF